MSIDSGTIIAGEYELEQKLGEGGFGRVWAARRRSDGARVAIKQPVYGGQPARTIDKYFRRELEALKAVDQYGGHDHIMRLLDHVTHDGSLHLVLEMVDGREFGTYMTETGRMTDEETREFGIALCDAMSLLHEQVEFMYRDLKADNVIVSADGVPTLIDFTTAREYDDEALEQDVRGGDGRAVNQTEVGGDKRYKPPELVGNAPYVQGPQTDVYSIGKVLYEARINWAPDDHGRRPTENDPSVADWLDGIIGRATSEKPTDRYRSAAAMQRALETREPVPAREANLVRVATNTTFTVQPGETIGREGAGALTNIAIMDDDNLISGTHCRLDLDSDGEWILRDRSTNGTYVFDPETADGWQLYLSEYGRQRLRECGHHDKLRRVKGTECRLRDSTTIALVDQQAGDDGWSWFRFEA